MSYLISLDQTQDLEIQLVNEVVILCRNVLICFNTELQNRVSRLFSESQGASNLASPFEIIDGDFNIYRKICG